LFAAGSPPPEFVAESRSLPAHALPHQRLTNCLGRIVIHPVKCTFEATPVSKET